MPTLDWLWSHIGSMDKALELLNTFCWKIRVVERGGEWYVHSGDHIIFSAESKEAVDAFVYGMALSLSGIPEPMHSRLVRDMQEWCETH